MKTQISVQVKNASIWLDGRTPFTKSKVKAYVDSDNAQPIVMKAKDEPYLIDVQPGTHRIVFQFKNTLTKISDKAVGAAFFGGMGLGAGGAVSGAMFAKNGADIVSNLAGHSRVQDNLLECEMKEGDILKVQIQPKRNGSVKVKLL